MSAHTKGPWHLERRNYDGLDSFVIADAAGMVIATLPAQWEADAILLAAAPELADALRGLCAIADEDIAPEDAVWRWQRARKVLERMEGRS